MSLVTKANTAKGAAAFAHRYLRKTMDVLESIDGDEVRVLIQMLDDCRSRRAMIYFIGNGGKAALSAEWANDLTVALPPRITPFRAASLVDNAAMLTAAANDYSYDDALAHIIARVAWRDDMLVALSGSGNSVNIIQAVNEARGQGMFTVGIGRGGKLRTCVDHFVTIPAEDDGPTEDAMMAVLHITHAWFLNCG